MTAPHDPRGSPFFIRLDQGVRIDRKAVPHRLPDHIKHGIPPDEADFDAVADDPSPHAGLRALNFMGTARRGVARGLRPRRCRRPPNPAAGVLGVSLCRRFT
jgi:hypothetical protein